MHVLIVVYELRKESHSKDYQGVLSVIKGYDHIRIGGSEYCIYTSDSPNVVFDRMSPYVDSNDRVLVARVVDPYQGWLSNDQWEWINERLR